MAVGPKSSKIELEGRRSALARSSIQAASTKQLEIYQGNLGPVVGIFYGRYDDEVYEKQFRNLGRQIASHKFMIN